MEEKNKYDKWVYILSIGLVIFVATVSVVVISNKKLAKGTFGATCSYGGTVTEVLGGLKAVGTITNGNGADCCNFPGWTWTEDGNGVCYTSVTEQGSLIKFNRALFNSCPNNSWIIIIGEYIIRDVMAFATSQFEIFFNFQ